MRLTFSALLFLGLSQVVTANPVFYNPTGNTIKVSVTLPNGEKVLDTISPGISNLGNRSPSVTDAVKQVEVEFLDEVGTALWKGKISNNTSYIIYPGAGGKTTVLQGGLYSGDNSVKAAFIANLTGENYTVEFIGQQGADAQRGLSYGPTFDKAKVFRFHPKEDSYKVRLVDAQGNRIEVENSLSTGRYHVIFKNTQGKYAIDTVGYIK